ncbi:helix-turn-helix domain-containing protein [Paenibacillus methanolicus]|uniref:Cytoskeletal protein RodZ n=1 Tax=Paenibacillus methanolicus TaxID=582686 RepID=A0A5S5CH77_9BACL|nr:RodZ family helix-turn-helix domain-containing protein [Paenibacillus methanolicus]TYP77586.1 cytoskeletal protein RodZ [Paenibacillus methanolicus]
MSDLGALLRKAREQRGYSLDDIQDLTKIRKRYLEAIEDGDYSILPGSFYVRAFVKNYAETVGLDAEEVLRLYQHEMPTPPQEPVVEPVQRPRRSQVHTTDRWSRWGFRALMWSFLILIVVIVYVFYINNPTDDVNTADDQTKLTDKIDTGKPAESGAGTNNTSSGTTNGQNATKPETVTPDPVVPATPPATVPTLVKSSGSMDYYEIATAGTHTIEIKATGGACWIGIRNKDRNGKYVENTTLQDGESITSEFTGPTYISVAKANIVEVKIDGHVLDDGDKVSKSHRFQLNLADTVSGGANGQATGTDESGGQSGNTATE